MLENSSHTRSENLKRMAQEKFDLVIIGGGINGAGIARDAAMRGMKVALVEANDFASGTSSRSSKMIHGGIRYLENKDFGLVFEALSERSKLFEMAPHLAHHLRFMIPIYEQSRVGMFEVGLGMWLYDALALFQAPELHERLNADESMQRMPSLKSDGLKGSFIYSDGYMDDDRLVHETLRSAQNYGALFANYTKAVAAEFKDEKMSAVLVEDVLTSERIRIQAHHVICSTGPWTDKVAPMLQKNWKPFLRPTKGIHLTLPKGRLPLSSAVVMGAEKGNRIIFGIPRHEMIVIGTTDTDFKEDPSQVVATEEDVRYLLNIVDDYFPGAKIKRDDIIASYAGVRPLVNDGSGSEGKTSREHTIVSDDRGITFVAGGKYTTYRHMSEQVVERALRSFTLDQRSRFTHSRSEEALNPLCSEVNWQHAKTSADKWASEFSMNPIETTLLAERHGLEGYELLCEFHGHSMWQIEAIHAIRSTMCLNLKDFYTRRTPLFLAQQNHGLEFLGEVSQIFQDWFNLSASELDDQKIELMAHMNRELAWKSRFLNRQKKLSI